MPWEDDSFLQPANPRRTFSNDSPNQTLDSGSPPSSASAEAFASQGSKDLWRTSESSSADNDGRERGRESWPGGKIGSSSTASVSGSLSRSRPGHIGTLAKRGPERGTAYGDAASKSLKKRRVGSIPKAEDMPTPAKPNQSTRMEGESSSAFSSPGHTGSHGTWLSSSDATGAMVSRMRTKNEEVTFVSLPRGTVKTVGTGTRTGSTHGSLGSVEYTSSSTDPETKGSASPAPELFQGIGLFELLEQDTRPTFAIDLRSPANASHAGLCIIYSNVALRSTDDMLELLETTDGDEPAANADFNGFKNWVTMPIETPEACPAIPSPHSYGGILWTSATLRGRLRIISGTARVCTSLDNTPVAATAPSPSVNVSPGGNEQAAASEHGSPFSQQRETPTPASPIPQEYFGTAEHPSLQDDAMCGGGGDVDGQGDMHNDEFTRTVLQSQLTSRDSFDWTRISLTDNLPDHIYFARTLDWASTPLGPTEDWAQDLRTMANLIMASPHAAAMYWGPEHVAIYNESYIELAGQKHPSLMGMRYREAWEEIWHEIEPVFQKAFDTGQAIMKNENQLFINRHGFLEETFFSWSIVPIVGADGEVVGLYNPAFENTRSRVAERRIHTLRDLGELTTQAMDMGSFWKQVMKGLDDNGYDVPFALIYSVRDDESESASVSSGSTIQRSQLVFEGSIGVPEHHPAAATLMDWRTSEEGFAPFIRRALQRSGEMVVLSRDDGTLPPSLIEGFEWRGFGDPCSTAVVLPIYPTSGSEPVVAFIVLGINPRRPFDDDCRLFISLLSRQLSTSLASVVLHEEEVKRGRTAALIAQQDNQELSKQLIQRTQEVSESENKFSRMAEFTPVGMFIAGPDGRFSYCNEMWWDISGHPRSKPAETWMESVREEDRAGLEAVWDKLINQKTAITHELRFRGTRLHADQLMDTWVLMSAYPEKDVFGSVKSIFGCITDISSQKSAEYFQKQRREEAVELKRQQENFIDITSHEMRNPLSAILQCADEIYNRVTNFKGGRHEADPGKLEELLDSCGDAANTINLCASHQKRIVDDILTLSKLDSKLLLVTPDDVQPYATIQRVLRMFEPELATHNIRLSYQVDPSYLEHEIDWVRLDPSRLRQVVINLMTNAIKFTQNCEKRFITVTIGASKRASDLAMDGLTYFPSHNDAGNRTHDADEWGHGDEINLHVSVRDTGPGIGEDEKKLLFQRFSQTSPRTHVQYGGSGLGLFISRMLTELQGGQIGVRSEKNVGSTFAFYIKARKSDNPPKGGTPTPVQGLSMQLGTTAKPGNAGKAPPRGASTSRTRQPESNRATSGLQLPLDVLIVEDNLVNQKVLQKQLRNQGCTTHVANHGGEALDILKTSRFWKGNEGTGIHISVILMDLEMPVMDGKTCVKKIRELESEGAISKHLPVIAVTAYARVEQINEAKALGVVSSLTLALHIAPASLKSPSTNLSR
jgi:signal transduction histidine kinase